MCFLEPGMATTRSAENAVAGTSSSRDPGRMITVVIGHFHDGKHAWERMDNGGLSGWFEVTQR